MIYGDELDLKYLATEDDEIQASIGYLHARAKDFVVGQPAVSYNNFELPEAPDLTITAGY